MQRDYIRLFQLTAESNCVGSGRPCRSNPVASRSKTLTASLSVWGLS